MGHAQCADWVQPASPRPRCPVAQAREGYARPMNTMRGVSAFVRLHMVLAIMLTACGPSPEEEESTAALLVETFLTNASGGVGDRGWQQLSPTTQGQLFSDDLEAYRREADAATWDGFEWEVSKVERDEPGFYQVVISHSGALPEFVSGLTSYEDGRMTGGPTFMVRFEGADRVAAIYQFSREGE